MEIIGRQGPVRHFETHGTNVLHLHVRDLNAQRLEFGDCLEMRGDRSGPVTWSVPSAGECPVIVPASKCGAEIGIEVMERQLQIGGKIMVQGNRAGNRQVGFFEFRMCVDFQLPSLVTASR